MTGADGGVRNEIREYQGSRVMGKSTPELLLPLTPFVSIL